MSRTCSDYQQWLKDRLAGELSEPEETTLDEHLASCAGCRLEQQQLESAVAELLTLEDEPVPHHFYVYEKEPAGWRRLLGQLSLWQRGALALAAAVFAFSIGLNVFQLHVSWTDEALAFSLGAPVATFDESAFREGLTDEIRTLVSEGDRRSQEQLRQEFQNTLAALETTDQEKLRRFVGELEQRLGMRVDNRNAELTERLENSLLRFYQLASEQRADDLNQISNSLQRLAAADDLQTDQVEAVMATVVDLAQVAAR